MKDHKFPIKDGYKQKKKQKNSTVFTPYIPYDKQLRCKKRTKE
jgi:hypothetical protein